MNFTHHSRIWVFGGLSFLGIQLLSSQTVISLRDPYTGVSARATAFADAYISETHDVGVLYWNPAALAFLSRSFVLMDYKYSPSSKFASYNLAIPFFTGRDQAFAVGFSFHAQPSMKDTSTSAYFAKEYGVDVASSTIIAYAISLGVRAGVRYGQNADSRAWAGFSSLGLYYEPTPAISYAFVYNGISLGTKHTESDPAKEVIVQQLPRSFQIGVSMHYPSSRREHVVTIGLANEKIIGQGGLLYKGGLEIGFFRFLTARVGYLVGP
ncbi:MAG: hypothetical protein HY276_09695, partial [Ignavibacteriales bacterium]|nr:hypothetical protein [Ignavibacteriales bacterium]